jgi:IS605 OrfB family transposase
VIAKQYDIVCIEDLSITKMLKNKRLAPMIHDASWNTFFTFLDYKLREQGKHFVKIDKYFPSTQTCSFCGSISGPKSLATRNWICPDCGKQHDRDINAAQNIKRAGLDTLNKREGNHRSCKTMLVELSSCSNLYKKTSVLQIELCSLEHLEAMKQELKPSGL